MVLKLVIFPFLMHQVIAFPFLPYSNPYFHYSTDASEASTQLKVGLIGVICFLMELLLLLICGCFRKKTPKMVAKEESEGETFKSLMFRTNFKASGKGYGTMTLQCRVYTEVVQNSVQKQKSRIFHKKLSPVTISL